MRRVFWSHVLVGVILCSLGLWSGTQYAAHALGYQAALGEPILVVKGWPIYAPWAWFGWAYHYDAYAPWVFNRASYLTWAGVLLMFGALVGLAIFRARKQPKSTLHGSARWAELWDLKQAGLLNQRGVILAQTQDACYRSEADTEGNRRWVLKRSGQALLRHDGPEHVFCFAPTRSGKGVGLVIPTLVTWGESVLVYDIKKENWALTAGWRRQFSHCLRFEPTAPDSLRFNPLMEVRPGDKEVQDVQNIADMLVDPEGSGEKRDHWQRAGHALLVGAMLYVLHAEPDKSLRGVANFLSNPQRSISETLQLMLEEGSPSRPIHPVVRNVAREMLNKSDNELSGVVSTVMSFLSLYRDPIISRNTEASDFAIADLMNSEAPVSLYLVVPPSDLDRIRPLIRLLLNQIGRRLTESMMCGNKEPYRHKLLMLLDEFPSLGRLNFFETELAYLAGYGIKCMLIAQSLNQIEKAYGPNHSILDNAHVRVTYGALDERTAKRISDLLGQATAKQRHTNFSGNRLAPWLAHMSESEHDLARPLLTPGEVLQLPFDDALVMVGGMSPYRGKKVMYYQDSRLKDRAGLKPPDAPEEQAKELLPKAPSVWLSLSSRVEEADSAADPSSQEAKETSPSPYPASEPSHDDDNNVESFPQPETQAVLVSSPPAAPCPASSIIDLLQPISDKNSQPHPVSRNSSAPCPASPRKMEVPL
jgi:type IV secretion system protein VirD4